MTGENGWCTCASTRARNWRPLPEISVTTASMPSAEVPDIRPTMIWEACFDWR
jgi:hypothetical protein